MNTGAEAVESAIKVARKWAYEIKGVPEGQAEIIVFADNFQAARSPSSASPPTRRRAAASARSRRASRSSLRRLRALRGRHPEHRRRPDGADPGRGRRDHPAAGLRERASGSFAPRERIILILDEIQTGLGRTGKLLAEEHEGVEADMTLIGKALSGGFYPVSAVLSRSDHGRAAARRARQDVRRQSAGLRRRARGAAGHRRGRHDRECGGVGAVCPRGPGLDPRRIIKEVRGRGLMLAVELHPDAGGARRYCEALKRRGILCKETHDHTIRISPPLVITRKASTRRCTVRRGAGLIVEAHGCPSPRKGEGLLCPILRVSLNIR